MAAPSVARNSKHSSKSHASTLALNSSADVALVVAPSSLTGTRCRGGTLAEVGVRSRAIPTSPLSEEIRCCTAHAHAHVACELAAKQESTSIEAAAHLDMGGKHRQQPARVRHCQGRPPPGNRLPLTQGPINKHKARSTLSATCWAQQLRMKAVCSTT